MSSNSSHSTIVRRRAHLLSNGRYSVMLTDAGGGYSHWGDLAVTRWREDPTRDNWGSHVLIRDASGEVLALGPAREGADVGQVTELDGICVQRRQQGDLEATMEVVIARDADAECRRIRVQQTGGQAGEISVTSYAELVIGPVGADNGHPAFSKMFVQTAWTDMHGGVLLAMRRKRTPDDPGIWAAHFVQDESGAPLQLSYESERAAFLGRSHGLRDAQAMQHGEALGGHVGTVLDPVFSLRSRHTLAAGEALQLRFWTVLADSRETVLEKVAAVRALSEADLRAHAAQLVEDRRKKLALEARQQQLAEQLLAPLHYADLGWRAPADQLALGQGGAPVLWSAGISGDRPIVLLQLDNAAQLPQAQDLFAAQRYWRSLGLAVDTVLLDVSSGNGDAVFTSLQAALTEQRGQLQQPGVKAEAFALKADAIDASLHHGLLTVARVLLHGGEPREPRAPVSPAAAVLPASQSVRACAPFAFAPVELDALEFANGYGGFAAEGSEYHIALDEGRSTPMPWTQVIANPSFGFLVTAEGGGYSWSINSQQNPLTPWPNDPVSDTPRDILYLRDEDSGELWSATASPIRVAGARYSTRYGAGWARFGSDAHGIDSDLLQFVPQADAVKISRLRLCNRGDRARRIRVSAYADWALGPNGSTPAPTIVTALDATGAVLARNPWRQEFNERVAFLDMAGAQESVSGDRRAVLGAYGSPAIPQGLLSDQPLNGLLGAGSDPCAALQRVVELAPGTAIELVVLLGDAESADAASALVQRYRQAELSSALAAVQAQWERLTGTLKVSTPERSLDVMANQWLLYQALACRMWARTAYYQSSGAYGFRDQLQDALALCLGRPDLAREHLLRAAGRQFAEGDVQHWWLPPGGQGIRTRIVDDRAWLPFVAAHYVDVSGDTSVLDTPVPLLQGDPLKDGQVDSFFQPASSSEQPSLYEHAARALDSSLVVGAHGLPLFGTGDWNDGMNSVGAQGRGESVWMSWFLLAVIDAFTPLAKARGDEARIARWQSWAAQQREAAEQTAWDGAWYRRGYYDDGDPLGSAQNAECRIDAIAQSWSVLGNSANRAHQQQAMEAVWQQLILHDAGVGLLFTPPFDQDSENPGYIKGYPPGLRENGGQYTHGSSWSIFAWARLGDGERAGALYRALNPVRHSDSRAAIERFKVEPYVACADVYSVEPLVGRGGWTWYTGSASWLYRAGVEALLGFHRHGVQLQIDPCIPPQWPAYRLRYRHDDSDGHPTWYEIEVVNPHKVSCGVLAVELDGQAIEPRGGSAWIDLVHDGGTHRLLVTLGATPERPSVAQA